MKQPDALHRGVPRPTVRLQELRFEDRESAYYASRAGDLIVFGLLVAVLLGNGVFIWTHVSPSQAHVGRAVFFGLALLCLLWGAVVYTFKLSVNVRVGPHGVSIVRGPWRTELPWREVDRLVERAQMVGDQRFRWVVLLARDGRRLHVREDMVNDYSRFRLEVYERYQLWRDHGGTWGANGSGPFTARETVSSQATWWGVLAGVTAVTGLYFTLLLPETGLFGPLLLAIAVVAGLLCGRAVARRQTYVVDARAIEAKRVVGTFRLAWREVTRVDRVRHPIGGVMRAFVQLGALILRLVDRGDARVLSFAWSPRVPEYLVLRGSGRQVRIALHRVDRPDELLAWVEFYERLGRRAAERPVGERVAAPERGQERTLRAAATLPPPAQEMSGPATPQAGVPVDPWASGAAQERGQEAAPRMAASRGDEWTRREDVRPVAHTTPEVAHEAQAQRALAAEDDAPTEAVESLAESFAPWQNDPQWLPPSLPRFGPAPQRPAASEEANGQADDTTGNRQDEWLR